MTSLGKNFRGETLGMFVEKQGPQQSSHFLSCYRPYWPHTMSWCVKSSKKIKENSKTAVLREVWELFMMINYFDTISYIAMTKEKIGNIQKPMRTLKNDVPRRIVMDT